MYNVIEIPSPVKGARTLKVGECYVIVGNEAGMWHLSISHPDRDPDWNIIKWCRYEFCPKDKTMVMVLPPMDAYVNLQEHCFHLWEIKDEEEKKKSRIHLI